MNKFLLSLASAGVILVATTFLIPPHNEVCCAYGSVRTFGWPIKYLILGKTTDDGVEAFKVMRLSTLELMRQGWSFNLGDVYATEVSGGIALGMDFLLFFVPLYGIISGLDSFKKYVRRKNGAPI